MQVLTQRAGGPVDHAADVASVLAARGHDSHVVGPVGRATARARAAGVTWHDVTVADKRDLAGATAAVRLLGRLTGPGGAGRAGSDGPVVTHLQDRRAGWLGRAGPRPAGGLVYTLHGVPDGLSDLVAGNALAGPRRRGDRLAYLHAERWLARRSRCRVVVPSRAVAAYAVDHVGLPAARVEVVSNGVDLHRFRPAASDAEAAGPVTAVWLGLLGEVKRPGVLVDAVARVPGLRLRVLGDGPLRAELESRVRAAGLDDRVELVGAVDDPAPALREADLLVLTSAAENLPLAVLQAMASGLPVVATAVGGVPELVRDGLDGLLVPVDDVAALAAALRRLADDPHLRRTTGASARARVEAGWGLDRCVDGLLEVYRRSAAERAR